MLFSEKDLVWQQLSHSDSLEFLLLNNVLIIMEYERKLE